MAKSTYSIVHPMFLKVVKTINSSETLEHISASQRLIDSFLTYIESTEVLGIFPIGYNRAVLATYYGQELTRMVHHQIEYCSPSS